MNINEERKVVAPGFFLPKIKEEVDSDVEDSFDNEFSEQIPSAVTGNVLSIEHVQVVKEEKEDVIDFSCDKEKEEVKDPLDINNLDDKPPLVKTEDVFTKELVELREECNLNKVVGLNILSSSVIIKEEDDIENDSVLEESSEDERDSKEHILVENNLAAPETNGKVTYTVKEDLIHQKENSDTFQKSSSTQIEDNSFGTHFLSGCLREDLGQLTNGSTESCDHNWFADNSMFPSEDISSTDCASPYSAYDKSSRKCETHRGGVRKHCKLCKYSTENLTDWYCHQENQHAKYKPFACQYCPFRGNNKHLLREHVIRCHSFGMAPIDCPYCKYKSLSLMEVEDHISKKHRRPKVYYHCPHCEYKNICKTNLSYHIAAKHTREMNFACPHCNYECILFGNMARHILKIHNKRVTNRNSVQISAKIKHR